MFHFNNKQHFLRFCIDALCIVACYVTAMFIAKPQPVLLISSYDVIFQFTLIVCWYYIGNTNNLYAAHIGPWYIELLKTFYNIGFQFIGIAIIYFVSDQPVYLKLFSLYYFIFMTIAIFAQKYLIDVFRITKRNNNKRTNVLIVGGGKLGMNFCEYTKLHPAYGYDVVGVLDNHQLSPTHNGQYLGKIDQLQEILESDMNINEIVVALPPSAVKSVKQVVMISKNQAVHVRVMPDYSHFVSPGFTVETFGGMLMVNPRPEPLEALHLRVIKRLFDIGFSLMALIFLCSWLFPIIAIVIKLNSKGPVFFKQLRSGKNTVPFYCYKFRSMYLNDKAHLNSATKNDPRITIIGKILRKTNIDELPQFFNVLIGQMAVVGPRPHMVSQNQVYSKIISQYMVRQLIKPGVTGLAQVSGYRGETKTTADMQTRIKLDVWYLEHWSFWMDIKIIFMTVRNMLKGDDKAY